MSLGEQFHLNYSIQSSIPIIHVREGVRKASSRPSYKLIYCGVFCGLLKTLTLIKILRKSKCIYFVAIIFSSVCKRSFLFEGYREKDFSSSNLFPKCFQHLGWSHADTIEVSHSVYRVLGT